jgi:hypothetical protein
MELFFADAEQLRLLQLVRVDLVGAYVVREVDRKVKRDLTDSLER